MSTDTPDLSTAQSYLWSPFSDEPEKPPLPGQSLQPISLSRHTPDPGGTLRPWDAADEYLVRSSFCPATESQDSPIGLTLILNDDFGAISCAVLQQINCGGGPDGDSGIVVINDSVVSRTAIEKNLSLLKMTLKERNSSLSDRPDSSLQIESCLLYTSPSPRDKRQSRMPSSA